MEFYVMKSFFSLLLVISTIFTSMPLLSASSYLVGMGSYDITGPAADVNMMGYANAEQIVSGVHFRLKARAFIVAEPDGGNRVAFVNLDACMASQLVTIKVLERLKSRYGDLYTEKNVGISGIHTHAGPGGYLQYIIYIITSLGFVRQSFDVLVDGIEKAIVQAHENLRSGEIYVNKGIIPVTLNFNIPKGKSDIFHKFQFSGELLNAGVNRSPSAHLNNPSSERSKYKYNVDKDMTLLKFADDEWGPVGSFNWFATHGTSMSRTNALISGDNKGAAARFMEDWADESESSGNFRGSRRVSSIIPQPNEKFNEIIQLASSIESTGGSRLSTISERIRKNTKKPSFVSAFCQSNCGDVSPNTLGAFCIDTGLSCDFNHSTCNGKNELCYGRGPGYPDEFESTRIIAERQVEKAKELFTEAKEKVQGGVEYRHVYLDFSKLEVKVNSSKVAKTCPAAMGFAFAAGTTDGPGAFDFTQGDDTGNPFWRLVRNVLKTPGEEQVKCQDPKPILLDTGEMTTPYDWAPAILPLQILRVGQVVILCVPGEFTTMAGRRLRDAVKSVLINEGKGEFDDNVHVVIAGLSNTYSQYVTTFEEYEIQRYEGASTLYGPHTLSAYIQEFKKLTSALVNGQSKSQPSSNVQPPDLLSKQIGLLPAVVFDSTPPRVSFGDVSKDVPSNSTFSRGDIVNATFWSACPRNDLLTNGTFMLVEMLDGSGTDWIGVYDDDDWCVRFVWSRPSKLSSRSHARIEWRIPQNAPAGVYRLRHYGTSKSLFGKIRHFTGTSRAFAVI